MKRSTFAYLPGGLALLSIPLTAWAITDSTMDISQWGSIGGNTPSGNSMLFVGAGNAASGGSYGMVSGYSCISYSSFSTVVGRWNLNTGTYDELFVVGMGTSGAGNQKNALEVFGSGRVRMPVRQGDIPMGVYTN